jgi:hypothetical protein
MRFVCVVLAGWRLASQFSFLYLHGSKYATDVNSLNGLKEERTPVSV